MRFGKPAETPRSQNILFDNIIHQNTGKKTLKMALKRTVNFFTTYSTKMCDTLLTCIVDLNKIPGKDVSGMSFDTAKKHLEKKGYSDRISEFDVSSATVELAAEAVGTEPARIAKSLTFMVDGDPVMVVCAGDVKVNGSKYKAFFHTKAKMLSGDEVREMVGHEIGGVCPFGIKEGVKVYLDESLKRFYVVYPACGSDNSAVKLTLSELEEASDYVNWVDVCVIP